MLINNNSPSPLPDPHLCLPAQPHLPCRWFGPGLALDSVKQNIKGTSSYQHGLLLLQRLLRHVVAKQQHSRLMLLMLININSPPPPNAHHHLPAHLHLPHRLLGPGLALDAVDRQSIKGTSSYQHGNPYPCRGDVC